MSANVVVVGIVVLFVLVVVMFVAVVLVIAVSASRSRRVLKDAGLDPMAAEAQLAAQASQSGLLAPSRTLEERLRELDDLHDRGVISDEERATTRARLLADG
jgi:type II secretory pathway pseudopilin PulG